MQPLYEITVHPVDLRQHGQNPYGEPLYRVVWADTRKTTVIHLGKRKQMPRYYHGAEGSCAGKWVLEKWAPPEVLVGITREQYAEMVAMIPNAAAEDYPEKGDWELSYVFDGHVDEMWLHKQLAMHEFRFRTMRDADRAVERETQAELVKKQEDETFDVLYEQAREESLSHE